MKRNLLSLLAWMVVLTAFAQPRFATIVGPYKDVAVKQQQIHPDQIWVNSGTTVIGQKSFDNTVIGTTWYDAQTVNYGNVMQRIWDYPDGTVGATWMSTGENLVPERGAGYNYFDGGAWGTPDPHVGPPDRMGWPSYAPWGPEGEIVCLYRYVANSGPIKFFKRSVKGTGEWIETEVSNPNNVSLVWHSMITSGENNEYIHLLALTYDTPYQGQANALLYYRSSDGAETWDIDGVIIDGLGLNDYATINILSYAWANPVGETIAFSYGFDEYGGRVFKSYDNGDNWEYIQVMDTGIDPFNPPADSDPIPCGIGSSACVLDSQGDVHVVFPRMAKIWELGELYYYPYTDGLIYWKEGMPVMDTTLISSYTLDYLYEAGNLIGWILSDDPVTIPAEQPSYANALCGFPQMSINAEDNLFVAASNLAPGYDNSVYIYRHIVISSSFDGGNTWNEPVDVNDDILYIFSECAYPAMAPVIGDDLHLAFQEDALPGTFEWPGPTPNHPAVNNNIMYMKIPKDFFVGVEEKQAIPAIDMAIYPNPVLDQATLGLNVNKAAWVQIELISMAGQKLTVLNPKSYNAGRHLVRLDMSELPPGIYFCVVTSDGIRDARKVVKR